MSATPDTVLPGLDMERLGDWLRRAVPEVTGGLTARLIAGGKSNLTYEINDGTRSWILRRPPLGHVLATAHDMDREYRVMTALHGTGVPVPRTHALCADDAVLGAPFYVMEFVAGRPYRRASELAVLGEVRTRAISESFVDTLGTLHRVDPEAVGLGAFGRPDGFLARQVSRWRKQMDASRTRDLPAADELHEQLARRVPQSAEIGIVHGDYRLDNVLVDEQDEVRAVVDWEMATLGDPLTDLALLLVYGRLAAEASVEAISDVATAPGFLSEAEIIERYAGRSSRDLSHFGFYLGLASYKLAGILEGIHFRYVHGQTVGDGFAGIGEFVAPLLEGGLSALEEYN